VAPFALSLPSLGVSSLDLGRLWQRRRPFFCVRRHIRSNHASSATALLTTVMKIATSTGDISQVGTSETRQKGVIPFFIGSPRP
jgi:hypothetical protein